jgi:hypothetical protein
MSTLNGRARVDADGTLRIPVPSCANREVEFSIRATGTSNGIAPDGLTRRRRTGPERLASIERLAGAITDPSFRRPEQGAADRVEPLE